MFLCFFLIFPPPLFFLFFFFNDTATTEIYTLSLHDALPISHVHRPYGRRNPTDPADRRLDRPGMRAVPGVVRRASAFVTPAGGRSARADRDRGTVHVRELRAWRHAGHGEIGRAHV